MLCSLRGPPTNTLLRTKEALDGLLKTQAEDKEESEQESDKEEEGPTQADDGNSDLHQEEATPANLEKEARIVDAKQVVNREKARADLEKRSQARVAALALKKANEEQKQADKEAARVAKKLAKASGLSKSRR